MTKCRVAARHRNPLIPCGNRGLCAGGPTRFQNLPRLGRGSAGSPSVIKNLPRGTRVERIRAFEAGKGYAPSRCVQGSRRTARYRRKPADVRGSHRLSESESTPHPVGRAHVGHIATFISARFVTRSGILSLARRVFFAVFLCPPERGLPHSGLIKNCDGRLHRYACECCLAHRKEQVHKTAKQMAL